MDPTITQEILDDLIPSLEALEARSAAVLEFLKHEGITTDEKLAPYLEQAASASNVRWLGVRVRIERLLSSAEKDSAEKRKDTEEKKLETTHAKPAETIQSQTEAGDNAKSAGPENPNEHTDKNKNAEMMPEDIEPKSKVAADHSTRKNKNNIRTETSEDKSKSAATGTEQKVA
jgi:hypothetical protein